MLDLATSFIACVEREPHKLAIIDGDIRLTYEDWFLQIQSVVVGLKELGLKKGDHVVTNLQNRYEAATLHWACQFSGIIITPINWRVKSEELDYCVENAGAKAVFFENVTLETVDNSQCSKDVIYFNLDVNFVKLLECPATIIESEASIDDVSVMFYTSGTTGRGKGVPRTHRAERAAAIAHIAQNQYGQNEVTLGVMPLYHTMGIRSLIAMCLINGIYVCQRRFSPESALSLIENEGITNLYLVPTLYHDLVHAAEFKTTDISSIKKLGFAGANMTDGLLMRLSKEFNPELFVNHYGSSEVYTFTIESDAPSKPGSAGKAGINQRIRVIELNSQDPDAQVPAGEEGQIIATLQSEEAFSGYWKRPEADKKSMNLGWYFTGDIGFKDDEGDLFVTGRVDDMIISGGENILPVEIESVLSLHEAVGEIAVVGLPHERYGKVVTAFIQCHSPVSEQELDDWCKKSDLAAFKRPRIYHFVKAIPKSPVGKILRRKLVDGEYEIETE